MTEEYGNNLFGEEILSSSEDLEEKTPLAKDEFNIFALTDALGERDKRKAWIIYEKALSSGMVADEIFWRVMWGVKALLLSLKCESAEEAGLNPFVYKKNKGFLRHWKAHELEKLSEDLVIGYHEARRGNGEIETMIEKVLLRI